jgi:hypothetical protein
VQVGKTKYQGLYNKPYAAVHPGALAAGTLLKKLNFTNTNCRYQSTNLFQMLCNKSEYIPKTMTGPITKYHDTKEARSKSLEIIAEVYKTLFHDNKLKHFQVLTIFYLVSTLNFPEL